MKKSLLLVLMFFSLYILQAENPPRLALVLSGGGAKGISHIAIIEELERRGIVPDMVLGTSAGALIGGFYSAGYNSEDLLNLVSQNDISQLASKMYITEADRIISSALSEEQNTIISLNLGGEGDLGPENAILDDYYINSFFKANLSKVSGIRDFDDLSIPFRAVGTDLTNGGRIVFSSGSLIEAMRASMAIPIVFSPVRLENGSYIVDGGIEDNMPVDLAFALGADYVLAVDCSDAKGLYNESTDDMSSLPSAVLSFMSYLTNSNVLMQYNNATWLIVPDTSSFSTLDFSSIDQIIEKGREAVRNNEAVFDEIEKIFAPYKGGKKYLRYKDRKEKKIEQIEILSPLAPYYEKSINEFVGKSMDQETLDEISALLDEIRHSEAGIKSVSYEESDGLLSIIVERGKKSTLFSLSLDADFGVIHDGLGYHVFLDPKIALSLSFPILTSMYLDVGLLIDSGLGISLGLDYPFSLNSFLYGNLEARYGQLSCSFYPGVREFGFGDDYSFSLDFGYSHILRSFRTDLLLSFSYIDISGINSSTLERGRETHLPLSFGLGLNYDGRKGEYWDKTGLNSTFALIGGYDFLQSMFFYNVNFSLSYSMKINSFMKLVLESNIATIRGPYDLASSYANTKSGKVSSDLINAIATLSFSLPSNFFFDIGLYAECFDKDGHRVDHDTYFEIHDYTPFILLDHISYGGLISAGAYTSFGIIAANCAVSLNGTFSFSVSFS